MKATALFVIILGSYMAMAQNRHVGTITDSFRLQLPVSTFSFRETKKYVNTIPSDKYCRGLGFFCREELKLQKVHLPVIFRVGSVDNCNYLEQKPGYK